MEKTEILTIICIIFIELIFFIYGAIAFGLFGAFFFSFIINFVLFFVTLAIHTNVKNNQDITGVPRFILAVIVAEILFGIACGGFSLLKIMIEESSFDSRLWAVFAMIGVPLTILYYAIKEIFPYIYAYIKGVDGKYAEFVEDNRVSLGLFTRPTFFKYKIVLANKYFILEFDTAAFSIGAGKLTITDKVNGYEYKIAFRKGSGKKNKNRKFDIFEHLCRAVDYDAVATDLLAIAEYYNADIKMSAVKVNYIDINQCSEAELTAIPGVTIAKAKHAIKVRKEQKLFLTMNQFYKAINLEEEFVEQIQSQGNKIILNSLPEYKKSNQRPQG